MGYVKKTKKQEEYDIKKFTVLQAMCNTDNLFFTRYFFKLRYQRKFIINPHHRIICEALNRVYRGIWRNIIFNIAPRFGKTELAVINFTANGLSRNPASKFIHLSYSDDLAMENSEKVKDIVNIPEYRAMFGNFETKKDSRSKKNWKTTLEGGMYSTAAGGQVTGFGAGLVDEEDLFFDEFFDEFDDREFVFNGALIIDDAIKPEDAKSDLLRETVNERWASTLENRVNSVRTPKVVMGQRTHAFDLPGYLLTKEPEDWIHISIPAILDNDELDKPYYWVDNNSDSHYTSLRDIFLYEFEQRIKEGQKLARKSNESKIIEKVNHLEKMYLDKSKSLCEKLQGDFPLWEFKMPLAKIYKMEASVRDTQYQQDPKPMGGLMYPSEWMTYYQLPFMQDTEQIFSKTDIADDGNCFLCEIKYIPFNKLYYVIDVLYTQDPAEITEPKCAELNRDVNYADFESNNGGKSFARNVERISRENGNYKTKFTWYHQSDNKEARIRTNASTVQNCIVFPQDWSIRWPKFYTHVTNYMQIGKNKYKDGPDTLTAIVEHQPYGDTWAKIS